MTSNFTNQRTKRKHLNENYNSENDEDAAETLPLTTPELLLQVNFLQKGTIKGQRMKLLDLTSKVDRLTSSLKQKNLQIQYIISCWSQLLVDLRLLAHRLPVDEASSLNEQFQSNLWESLDDTTTLHGDEEDEETVKKRLIEGATEATNLIKHLLMSIENLNSTNDGAHQNEKPEAAMKLNSLCDELHSKYRRVSMELKEFEYKNEEITNECKAAQEESRRLDIEINRLNKQLALQCSGMDVQTEEPEKQLEVTASPVEPSAADDVVKREEIEDLEWQLRQKGDEIGRLRLEKQNNLMQIDKLFTSSMMTNEVIIESPIFQSLKMQCGIMQSDLKKKCKEVEDLRKALLQEQNRKDEEYEQLLNSTKEQQKHLMDTVSSLTKRVNEFEGINTSSVHQLELVNDECKLLRQSLREAYDNLGIRITQWNKLKQQYEQLKMTGVQMIAKHEKLKEEKTQLIDLLKEKDTDCKLLAAKLRNGSEGGGGVKDVEGAVEKIDASEVAIMRSQLLDYERRLKDFEIIQTDLKQSQEQLHQVSEEVEEVSKAFEERQNHCEDLMHQIHEHEQKVLQKDASYSTLKNNYTKYMQLTEKKLAIQKQKCDKAEALVHPYAEAVAHANARASTSEEQRDKQMAAFLEVRSAMDSLAPECEELRSQIDKLKESSKEIEERLNDGTTKYASLEEEYHKLRNEKNEAERRWERMKTKEQKYAAKIGVEDLSTKDIAILAQENEELRRRVLCSVCSERFRDHIIVKCGHIFCKDCLEKNIKTRNRRCSLCKINFDLRDTLKMYFD